MYFLLFANFFFFFLFSSLDSIGRQQTKLLKTDFGTFDISTKTGRQKWIQALNDFNERNSKSSIPTVVNSAPLILKSSDSNTKLEESNSSSSDITSNSVTNSIPLSSDSGCDSARIEFIIPKNIRTADTLTTNSTSDTSTATDCKSEQTQKPIIENENNDTNDPSIKKDSLDEDGPRPPVIMTLSEIKEKLEESEKKNYRRLFLPGRGWISAKKLQEEVNVLESQGKVSDDTQISLCGEGAKSSDKGISKPGSGIIILKISTSLNDRSADINSLPLEQISLPIPTVSSVSVA